MALQFESLVNEVSPADIDWDGIQRALPVRWPIDSLKIEWVKLQVINPRPRSDVFRWSKEKDGKLLRVRGNPTGISWERTCDLLASINTSECETGTGQVSAPSCKGAGSTASPNTMTWQRK